MLRQIKQAFTTPKFLVGFVIFMSLFLAALIYPQISPVGPLQFVTRQAFTPPGRYINVQDVVENRNRRYLLLNVEENRVANVLTETQESLMIDFLETHGGFAAGSFAAADEATLIDAWNAYYDPDVRIQGMTLAAHNQLVRFNQDLQIAISEEGVILAVRTEDGLVEDTANAIESRDFVNVNDVVNTFVLPLGTDNFGRDVLTQLLSAVLVSLRLGFIAGAIATSIGLTLGLVSGYVGGFIDDAVLFITNLFTVIPGFILLILISNSLSPGARSVEIVAIVIGLTAWPWTCRSVRSQVLSLRNRDHVSLSKLSGHSMPRIILNDILPYVASYVVMALILQTSTAILAESMLSMLGLGPSTTEVATLGLMMSWAQMFSAWQAGAWWAFVPVILAIATIAFSMNLMNTGLDQVFNPQLREG
ncbi:MAG: ABC transporter permease [Defluviitaleaceae bacterium]|nr:ABC transporter permease [Defluviitaleaceae bacterium]